MGDAWIRSRRWRGAVAAALLTVVVALGGCGSHHGSVVRPTSTPSRLIQADHWTPPSVVGGPSVANFCTLLVAQYNHVQTNTRAATLAVREQIIQDYIDFTPAVVAAAPPQIAPAATLYLQGIDSVLAALKAGGLNPTKAPSGVVGSVIANPQIQAAGAEVEAFSQQNCHYDITGSP